MKSSLSIWKYVVSVKLTVSISSNFVAFLENTNFNYLPALSQSGSPDFWWPVYSSSNSLFFVQKEWKIDQRSTYKGKIKRLLWRAPYGSTQAHWSIFGFEKIGSVVNPQYMY